MSPQCCGCEYCGVEIVLPILKAGSSSQAASTCSICQLEVRSDEKVRKAEAQPLRLHLTATR